MFFKIGFVALSVYVLAGCVGMESTFKPYDDFSGGYGDTKLAEDAYIVFFDANGMTEPKLTESYFQRRSAQLTLKAGYDCFVALEKKKTLFHNYVTNNKLAINSKKYSAAVNLAADPEANKPDANSLAGIIQLHKKGSEPASCIMANQVLEQYLK